MPRKTVQIVHERVGIVDTREDREQFLTAVEVTYRNYSDKSAKAAARRKAVDFAITRALNPKSPIEIDWTTNAVFISDDGWTRQIARFNTEQYQITEEAA